jgi:RNA polymerase-binding protein DksA
MRDDIDFDRFRKLLEEQLSNVQQRLDQETKSMRAYSAYNTPDVLDAGVKAYAQGGSMGWIVYLREKKNQIEAAILRLDAGKFGICAHCGKNIEIERLEATPHVPYCIKCQKKKEQGYK